MATRQFPWWEELIVIPDVEDIQRLAQKIWASFDVPSVRMDTLEVSCSPCPLQQSASKGVRSYWMDCHARM